MNRSKYVEDLDMWQLIRWRGAVQSAIRGRRGQKLLKDLLVALDAMPDKRLISYYPEREGKYCALGLVCNTRGIELPKNIIDIDYFNPNSTEVLNEFLSSELNIANALVREIEFINDECTPNYAHDPDAERWRNVRTWVATRINKEGQS